MIKNLAKLISFIALTVICSFLWSAKSYSAASDLITNLAPLGGSAQYSDGSHGNNPFTPVTGVASKQGAFNGQYSWVKVYVPWSGGTWTGFGESTNVIVNQVCEDNPSDGSGIKAEYKLIPLNASEQDYNGGDPNTSDTSNRDLNSWQNGGNCNNAVKFKVNGRNGQPSKLPGHDKYRVFALIAVNNGSAANTQRYFRVTVNNPNARVGLSDSAGIGGELAAGDNYFTVFNLNNNVGWSWQTTFAARCGNNNPTGELRIYDPDNGIYQGSGTSYPPFTATIYKASRNGPDNNIDWQQVKHFDENDIQGDGPIGASHTTSTLDFPMDSDHIYKVTMENIHWPNIIQVHIPFDQIDSVRSLLDGHGCNDWKLDGNSYVKNQNGNFTKKDTDITSPEDSNPDNLPTKTTFRHTIKNTGEVGGSFHWVVKGCYVSTGQDNKCKDPNNYSNSYQRQNRIDNAGGGGDLPGPQDSNLPAGGVLQKDYVYQFPSNAKDGAKYCQYISYNPPAGWKKGVENSNIVCVKLDLNTLSCGDLVQPQETYLEPGQKRIIEVQIKTGQSSNPGNNHTGTITVVNTDNNSTLPPTKSITYTPIKINGKFYQDWTSNLKTTFTTPGHYEVRWTYDDISDYGGSNNYCVGGIRACNRIVRHRIRKT